MLAIYVVLPNACKEYFQNQLLINELKSTLIASHGSFLNEGQTTFVIVTEEEKLDQIRKLVLDAKKDYIKDHKNSKLHGILCFSTPVTNLEIL